MKTPKASSEKKTPLTTPRGGKVSKLNNLKGGSVKNTPGTPKGTNLTPFKANLAIKAAKENFTTSSPSSPKKKGKNILNGSTTTPVSTNSSFSVDKVKQSPKIQNASPMKKGSPQKRKSDEGTNATKAVPEGSPKNKKTKGGKSPEVQLGLKIEKLLKTGKNEGTPVSNKSVAPNEGSPSSGKKKKNKNKKGASPNVQPSVANKTEETADQGGQGKKKRKRNNKKKKTGEQVNSNAAETSSNAEPSQKKKNQPKAKKSVNAKSLSVKDHDASIKMGDFPNRVNTEGAIKVLLAETKSQLEKKPNLLEENSQIFANINFFKTPKVTKSIQRILLPHNYIDNPDIICLVTDIKSARTDPDQSVEHHKELFKSKGVDNISEIIPWKRLAREYNQFEEKRKLANRGDIFLIDSKLSHRWPSLMRKKFMKRKAPIPVRLSKSLDLKNNVNIAIRKTSFVLKSNSRTLGINCGHPKMNIKNLVDNIVTVGTVLCNEQLFPGGKSNIRSISIKTAKSQAFPIYVSTASPNTAVVPKQQRKGKGEVVVGEVTTAGATVAVHPGGKIKILSRDQDEDSKRQPQKKKLKAGSDDDSEDDEDFDSDEDSEMETSKELNLSTSRASDDEESSGDEEEIDKAEQEFLQELRKQQDALEAEAEAAEVKAKKAAKKLPKQAAKRDENSEEEDEDSELDDDIDDEDDSELDDDIDDEELDVDDEEDDDSDIPDLAPTKVVKPQAGGFKNNKQAGQNKGGKNKPAQIQGKSGNVAVPKGQPGKANNQKGKFGGGPGKGKQGGSPNQQQQKGKFGGGGGKGKPGNSPNQQQKGKFGGGPGKGVAGNSPNQPQKGGKFNKKGSPNSKMSAKPGKFEKKGKGQERYFNMKMGGKKK